MTDEKVYPYDVALSFAGEDRPYVAQVAKLLAEANAKVFYDEYETATLWGKDLYQHLRDVYLNQARFTVLFASQHYVDKVWTNHERQSAQARAISERTEYILPARFDDTEVPGLLATTGYVDLRTVSPGALVKLILEKLGRKESSWALDSANSLPDETFARGESLRALASRMRDAAQLRENRSDFLRSQRGVSAAGAEVLRLKQYIADEVAALKAADPSIDLRSMEGRDEITLVSSSRASFTMHWGIRFSNSLTDSSLFVREFDGWYHLQDHTSRREPRNEIRFVFDVDENMKLGWRDREAPSLFMTSNQVGDKLLSAVIERMYGA